MIILSLARFRQACLGFDGLWQSPTGFYIVIEVKTTEVYTVKAATLVGYIDELISEKKISSWDNALGLYVIGRSDPEIRQLENAIVAEKRTHHLRVISVESLLSLTETMNEYDVSHEDILAILRPSGPRIDPVVDLMARLVAQPQERERPPTEVLLPEPSIEEGISYWLTPVRAEEEQTAEEVIETLVGQERIYAFGERTPGRKHLKPGDWICFYATTKGVVAHAKVISSPQKARHPKIRHAEMCPWVFRLDNVQLYLDKPVIIDAALRSNLDAFEGRDRDKAWAWFVQATRRISAHDFDILTRRESQG